MTITTHLKRGRKTKTTEKYRLKYNAARYLKRQAAKLVLETAIEKANRVLRNKNANIKYKSRTVLQNRRLHDDATKIRKQLLRKYSTLSKAFKEINQLVNYMETDENVAYAHAIKLKTILSTPVETIIQYLTGPLCNMARDYIQQLDSVVRLGLFIQLKRVNELFSLSSVQNRKWNAIEHSAYIINHFHSITKSFNDDAISEALKTLARKTARAESGAFSKLQLTVEINTQAFRSVNYTGFQAVVDSVNRDNASFEGIMPSRNSIQQCADQIAIGTKERVSPTIESDYRVYCVDVLEEFINITNEGSVASALHLTTDLVERHLDATYDANPKWGGCIVKIDMTNAALVSEVNQNAIDMNFSCDGFVLASSSNGAVGFIATFKGKEILKDLNKDYDKQKNSPEFGDRAG